MSPGINDHPRNTGALPKSNRYTNRNKERDTSAVNHNLYDRTQWYNRSHQVPAQHSNNLFQLDWHPVCERQATSNTTRTTKNSNTRSTYTATSHESLDFGLYNAYPRIEPHLDPRQEHTSWLKMTPPIDPRTHSPPNDPAKPTNTDKMPERGQVEGRLNQIREYIKITSTMMESLSQSSDSRAIAQHEKLGKMVEDLYDSEQKLSKLMEECQKYWRTNENGEMENGESRREQDLRKKVEESQRKLAQLQEHQAQLMGMQLSVRERLNEARQTQRALLAEEANENEYPALQDEEVEGGAVGADGPTAGNVEKLERETEALRGKLEQLENKKRHMDHLVQELQAVDIATERGSCSSDGSRVTGQRDKVAELQAMKAQLSHLKALMDEATRCREGVEPSQLCSEPEHDGDAIMANNDLIVEEMCQLEENTSNSFPNFFNEMDETIKPKRSGDPPTIEQIQAVTRELKEQQLLLQSARAELHRLKQGSSNSVPSLTSSTPPPSYSEKKQSNKRRQFEDFMRKDPNNGSSVTNQNGGQEWGSRRNSNSINSHGSTPGNLWPPSANLANGSHEHSVDGISAAENLLEMGSQPPLENGFGGNFWEMPTVMTNQPPQGAVVGSAEYYKQLLLGSQAQQLQMMSTTIQQCCQLLWSQQREMQSMRSAIVQIQGQLRHTQSRSSNNLELHEEQHSNLGRAAAQQHFGSLDAGTLPPSSSLPNLVSLPSTSPAPPLVVSTLANCQQQQPPPQLNNQVPPGNRANNYWDNFRSYSRQNLLSGSSKTATDCAAGTSAYAALSANTTGGVIGSHVNNKCNRQHDLEHLPMPTSLSSSDNQYSLNLQLCSRHQPLQQCSRHQPQLQLQQHQQQDRESNGALRNNCIPTHDGPIQQLQLQHQHQHPHQHQHQQHQHQHQHQHQYQHQHQQIQVMENIVDEVLDSFRSEPKPRDEACMRIAKKMSEREDLKHILIHCLNVLESRKQNENSSPLKYLSNSSDTSDDEFEAGARNNIAVPISGKTNAGTQITFMNKIESTRNCSALQNVLDQADSDVFSNEVFKIPMPSISSSTPGGNDDFAPDQAKPEPCNNNQAQEVVNQPLVDVSDKCVEETLYSNEGEENISQPQYYMTIPPTSHILLTEETP